MQEVVVAVLENVTAGVIVAGAGAALLWFTRMPKKLVHMVDDWFGEEARPGVPARPGVMERLQTMDDSIVQIQHEVNFNSGKSIKDAVHRTDENVAQVAGDVTEVAGKLDKHIALAKQWQAMAEKRLP